MKSPPPNKYPKTVKPVEQLDCRACGLPQPMSAYRLVSLTADRQLHIDFCSDCEIEHGTVTLYRRYSAYGDPDLTQLVFKINRTPVVRREAIHMSLLVEATHSRPFTREGAVCREFARRELSRRRLIYFTTVFNPKYQPGWVHQDICRRLEKFVDDVAAGKSPRLMLFMPPRAGKSLIASDMLPSWALGKFPEWSIISSSYAQSLPVGFSRNIRTRLRDPEYQAIFPGTQLSPDSQGVEAWNTTKGGGYIAAGIGTGITGKGGNILILDDPVKDQEAADSELILENTYGWYQSTFSTRLAPGGGILVIQTRWKFNDPAGRMLEDDEALRKAGVPDFERNNWEVVEYPALAEDDEYLMVDGTIMQGKPADETDIQRMLRAKGEALHPERYSTADMRRQRNTLSPAIWNALYQQRPTPEEGDFFKRADFVYRWLDPAYRPLCRIFMTVDYAIGKKERNDFTVAGVFALDADDNLHLLDFRRGRWGTMEIVKNIADLIEQHKVEVFAGEQGALHEAIWPLLDRELRSRRLYVSIDDSLRPIQDKQVRARPLQGRMQRRKMIFSFDSHTKPESYDILERELLQFPNGKHDDILDMLAWGGRLALNIALPNSQAPAATRESWRDRLVVSTAASGGYMAG